MQGRIITRGVPQGTGLKIVPFDVFIDDPEKRSDGAMRKFACEKVIWQSKDEYTLQETVEGPEKAWWLGHKVSEEIQTANVKRCT